MPHYVEAPEVENVAKAILAKGLQQHAHKEKVNIGYLFRDKAPISKGRVTYGMTIKVDDRNHVFNGRDVIIEISQDTWERMTPELKEALVDHELCHVGFTLNEQGTGLDLAENGRPKVHVMPHDFEDFEGVLDRHPSARTAFRKLTETYLADIQQLKKDKHVAAKGGSGTPAA